MDISYPCFILYGLHDSISDLRVTRDLLDTFNSDMCDDPLNVPLFYYSDTKEYVNHGYVTITPTVVNRAKTLGLTPRLVSSDGTVHDFDNLTDYLLVGRL